MSAVLVFAFVLVCFVAPRVHRIYYDEDIYANVGQNIALADQNGVSDCGSFEYGEYTPHWLRYNKHPSGWPFRGTNISRNTLYWIVEDSIFSI